MNSLKIFMNFITDKSPKKSICLAIFFLVSISTINFVESSSLPEEAYERLNEIHKKVTLLHGDINCELPEQLLSANFLPSDAKVLELGADVGRNSCVIGTILEDSSQMVSVEPRLEAIPYLTANRDHNGLNFHIEPSAVSMVPLLQQGWSTIPSEVDLPGYTRVNTITFDELMLKYGIDFDTLIVDCEGGLYYILKDDPSILSNIKLIIIENDFASDEHQRFVVDKFRENGFEVIHNEGPPYRGDNSFYQVWSK